MMVFRKRALVALSSFKGTLSNLEATRIVSETLEQLGYLTSQFPIADGGRGTLNALQNHAEIIELPSQDPSGKSITAQACLWPNAQSPRRALVEAAQTCGPSDTPGRIKPTQASSSGLGIIIRKLLMRYPSTLRSVWIALGDTATSDCGLGLLKSLGFGLFSDQGPVAPNAAGLGKISAITLPKEHARVRFVALCDVRNPLTGPNGSALVFGPQKGFSKLQIQELDRAMHRFSQIVEQQFGRDVRHLPYGGAAGGIAACLAGIFDAPLLSGSKTVLGSARFLRLIEGCDLVVTGEGRTDSQTENGKGPWECAHLAKKHSKQLVLISGSVAETPAICSVFPHRFTLDTTLGPQAALIEATRRAFHRQIDD